MRLLANGTKLIGTSVQGYERTLPQQLAMSESASVDVRPGDCVAQNIANGCAGLPVIDGDGGCGDWQEQ